VITPTDAELAALSARTLTKTKLAAQYKVSPTYISRITPRLPPGPVAQKRKLTKILSDTRKAYRTKLAKQVIAGRRGLESAAREANCSIRTMYRYICKLRK
jgi:hypothetical protein